MIQITPKGAPTTTGESPLNPIVQSVGQPDTNVGKQEANPAPEAPALEKPDPLSPKFALLAKREKLIRSREAEIKAKEDALKAKQSEYETGYIPKSGLKDAALAALKSGELSYDEFTQFMLSQPAAEVDPVIRQIQAENAELKKRLEELDGSFKSKQTTEFNQAVTQLGNDIRAFVKGNPDYEAIDALGMSDKVKDLIVANFEETGTIMPMEDAAKEIEAYLLEEAEKVLTIGKVKAKFTPPTPATEAKPDAKPLTSQQQPMKTLTNAVTTSKPMSPRERAIARLEGRL